MSAIAPDRPLLGCREPRLWTPPRRELTPETSAGFSAIEFADDVLGVELLPWQRWLLVHALELNDDRTFRFRTVLILVARQNGKSTLAQVWALWHMYMARSPLVLGTAQSLDTAEEVWQGAVDMAESVPDLAAEIEDVLKAAGKKTLKLSTGERYKVASANRRGGRGLSGDFVLLDELREHQTWDAWSAISKTTMARPRAQVVALSNAGDDQSVVLNHLRSVAVRDLTAPNTDVGLFEWSAPDDCELDDREVWAQANPSLGYLIEPRAIESALTTDPPHVFRTEVLCQRVDVGAQAPLPLWPDRVDADSRPERGWRIGFAVDVSWDRQTAWIAAAAARPDGRVHVEVVASAMGTDWVAEWIRSRMDVWSPVGVALQASGAPVSSLAPAVEDVVGTARLAKLGTHDLGRACGQLFDEVAAGTLVHTGQQQLAEAARAAIIRPLGDAWVFDRKKSPVDVAPLMAAAEAVWLVRSWVEPEQEKPRSGRVYVF